MQIVKLLERGVGLGARKLAGKLAIEGIVEDTLLRGSVGREALNQSVPRALGVQHHRKKFK
ncbi:MAG TPA: hypothetical protein VKB84_17065 [Candidatus Binataceae bacterium]|nr:hypothetical protein [Candidatus Binataceae bacterium]